MCGTNTIMNTQITHSSYHGYKQWTRHGSVYNCTWPAYPYWIPSEEIGRLEDKDVNVYMGH